MKPIIKWPGGKEHELGIIRNNIPDFSGRYIEPFLGGGAVFFDMDRSPCFLNDRSAQLIEFYSSVKIKDRDFSALLNRICLEFSSISAFSERNTQDLQDMYSSSLSVTDFLLKHDDFFSGIAEIEHSVFDGELIRSISSKLSRTAKLEVLNGGISGHGIAEIMEAGIKSAYYMYIRYLFNHPEHMSPGERSAVFFFIREYCYSSMFRYNKRGEFNVPYGGISYNRKDLQKKADYLLSGNIQAKLSTAELYNEDFEEFINRLEPNIDDFIFLDPPYDSDFSTYEKNSFGQAEQIRLNNCLKRIRSKIMLVIKNTGFIYDLYREDFNISYFDKKYLVSFKNRNDRNVRHLIITNY